MSERIIIIDDDETTESIVQQTAPVDTPIRRYDSARTGLKKAYKSPPALIILSADIEDGYRACRRLKREEKLKDIGLILLSGEATREQFEEHAKLSTRADLYLHKPLDGAVLADAIAELMGRSAPEEGPPPLPEDAPEPPVEVRVGDSPETPRQAVARLEGEVAQLKRERDALRIEVSQLTERLHNVKRSHRRAEEGFEAELEALRSQAAGESADPAEVRRLRALYDDLSEAMEVIVESLRVPLELAERHQELRAQGDEADDDDLDDDLLDGDLLNDSGEESAGSGLDEFEDNSSLGFAAD